MRISVIVAALLMLTFLTTSGIRRSILLQLPSTVLHELSHWLVALVLGCQPRGFSVVPRRTGKRSWRLGQVQFTARAWSAGWVALAPLWVLGPWSLWLMRAHPAASHWHLEVLAGVGAGILAWGAIPSPTDIGVALKHPLGTALLIVLAILIGGVTNISTI